MPRIDRSQRPTKSHPCPACGHTSAWCYKLKTGDAIWCGRSSHLNAIPGKKHKSGWIHQLDPTKAYVPPEPTQAEKKPIKAIKWAIHAATYQRQSYADPDGRGRFAIKLGVSLQSLQDLGLGWASSRQILALDTSCRSNGAWTFPMAIVEPGVCVQGIFNASTRIVGIRLRTPTADAFKYAITGSQGGLFIPSGLENGCDLLCPEGPTSTAALLTLGFSAIGRPNNRSGVDELVSAVRKYRPRKVIIIGDNDAADKQGRRPGQDGMVAVSSELAHKLPHIPVSQGLPPAVYKDVRTWLQAGATPDLVACHFGVDNPRNKS